MKYELNCSYNGGGDAYLLQSVAIHFNHKVLEQRLFLMVVLSKFALLI